MAGTRSTFMITSRFITALRHVQGKSGWTIAQALSIPMDAPRMLRPDTDLAEYTEPMVRLAGEMGVVGNASSLLIPGTWVLSHSIILPNRRFDPSAAAYAFENYVPLPVEELTCTFLTAANGEHLGLAVVTQPLRVLLDALSEQHVHIDELTLSAFAHDESKASADGGQAMMLWIDRDHMTTLVRSTNGSVDGLRTVRFTDTRLPDAEWVASELALLGASDSETDHNVCIVGPGPNGFLTHLGTGLEAQGIPVDSSEPTCTSCPAARAAGAGLRVGSLAFAGRWHAVLRRLERCAALLAVLLGVLAIGFHRQQTTLLRAIDDYTQAEQRLYQQSFPGRPIPSGIALRAASERIRLEGLTRSHDRRDLSSEVQPTHTVLETLRTMIAVVPQDVRLFVQDMQVEEHRLSLRGTARSHTEAERIAAAWRDVEGFSPSPPRSDALRKGGVRFSVEAQRVTRDPKQTIETP